MNVSNEGDHRDRGERPRPVGGPHGRGGKKAGIRLTKGGRGQPESGTGLAAQPEEVAR